MSNGTTAKRVKVKPYPILGLMELNGAKMPIEILLLNGLGILANVGSQFVHVGEHYHVNFEIPVAKTYVNAKMRAFKTYDKMIDAKEHKLERIVELQFETLTKEQKASIVAFAKAIGQK